MRRTETEHRFHSNRFLPKLPEDCQVNPGLYGFELAHWLALALNAQGIPTSYPASEDWGWYLQAADGETKIMIGCASICDHGEGYSGRPIEWRIFFKLHRAWGGFFGKPSEAGEWTVERIAAAALKALAEEGISAHVAAD